MATMKLVSLEAILGDDGAAAPDDLYDQASSLVTREQKCSASFIQRSLGISYNKAAALVVQLEADGIVSAPNHLGAREIHGAKNAFAPSPKLPLKQTPEDAAVSDAVHSATAEELRQFIEQWEHLEAEKKDIAEQQKDVMSEAKARGYDTKVLRKVITLRKRNKDDIAEEEAILELYKTALGML